MFMIWCLHHNSAVILNSLVIQGSFLFYTGKCIMMEAPESKKGPLRHAAVIGGESPLSQPPLLQVVKDIIVFAEAVHIYAGR